MRGAPEYDRATEQGLQRQHPRRGHTHQHPVSVPTSPRPRAPKGLRLRIPCLRNSKKAGRLRMRSVLQILLCLTTIVLGAALSASADLVSAQRAYERKDYVTALKESTPLAKQGNAGAQLLLGRMYLMGQGVIKDNDQASKWFEISAAQGNADAQFMLGSMYLLPQKDVAKGAIGCASPPTKEIKTLNTC